MGIKMKKRKWVLIIYIFAFFCSFLFLFTTVSASEGSSSQSNTASPLPKQFDLREIGAVTPVKNQGSGNVCWSYAVISSLESNMIINGLANNTINLSEKHLAWFTKYSKNPNSSAPTYGDGISITPWSGCDPTYAGYILMGWSGPSLESIFPIKNVNDLNTYGGIREEYRYNSFSHVQDMIQYSKNDSNAIKQALMKQGAMVISFYSAPQYYNNNSEYGTSLYCDDENAVINHSACLVGWDDNYPKEYFNSSKRPSKDGAWLIKNSWGKDAGENGYQWISYEDKAACGFLQFLVEPNNNYDTIYQYDGFGWGTQKSSNAEKIKGSNVFTAATDCTLKATAIHTSVGNVNYTISIYKNVSNSSSNPESGTLCTTQTGSFPHAGYHTIKLKQPIPLQKGTGFSIVVTFSSKIPGGEKWISLEGPTKEFSSNNMKESYGTFFYNSKKGQSFYNITGSWIDAHSAGYNNVCIKAYTCHTPISSLTQNITNISSPSSSAQLNRLKAPSKITITKETPSKVRISWSQVRGAKGYQIYFSNRKNGPFHLVGRRTSPKQTSFILNGLKNNNTYYFKVQAYNKNQNNYKVNGKYSKVKFISMKKALSLSEIKVSTKRIALKKKHKKRIQLILPKQADKSEIKSIFYKANNKKIISISKTGVITGIKKGYTTIKVTITLKNKKKKCIPIQINVK